ncbi:MAG: type 1 glutamine amidotransferase [Myxococcota bacterium]|nr:type 1 glutamine amidotransferase [Myxococcota bacterium]
MSRSRSALRVLLLQIRDAPKVRREEHLSFARQAGLEPGQIDVLNAFDERRFPASAADGYDALFVGGASEASVLEPEVYDFVPAAFELIRHARDAGQPVFASCFGFQLAVVAFGGRLQRDERDFEMGTIPIRLTEAARSDPILHDAPDGFLAVSVHRERSLEVPSGCVELANTDACCHVFRVADEPFWAFQFHPEVDRDTLIERLTHFKDAYTEDDAHLKRVLDAARETPESNHLVTKFVDRILLGEAGR